MRVLEGEFPEGKLWRTMILLSIGESPGVSWDLVKQLVKSNSGELILAFILSRTEEGNTDQASQVLAQAKAFFEDDVSTYTLLIEATDKRKTLLKIVEEGDVDFLVVQSTNSNWPGLNSLPCTVGAIRGEVYSGDNGADGKGKSTGEPEDGSLKILMPTSAGPNTLHALNLLMSITNEAEVMALYIAQSNLGPREEALGYSRLRQVLSLADANERVKSKLIISDSVIDGIVSEASQDHDLVIIGASQESSLDKALFGNVPAAVVRESRTPVMVIRQPESRMGDLARGSAGRFKILFRERV